MSVSYSPRIVTDGLQLALDAASKQSYPGSGNTWYDLSGNNLDLTLINSPTFSNDRLGCFYFNGSNQWARILGSDTIRDIMNSDVFSLSVNYSNINIAGVNKSIFVICGSTCNDRVQHYTSGSYDQIQIAGGPNGLQQMTNPAEPNNIWVHMSVVFNGTNMILRINNQVVAQTLSFGGSAGYADGNLGLGAIHSGGQYFNGYIASFQLYDRVLSESELSNNYYSFRRRFQ